MATNKKRLSISLPDDIDKALSYLAKRDNVPQATKAVELLEIALEIEEDRIWGTIAKKRNAEHSRFLSHKEVWGE